MPRLKSPKRKGDNFERDLAAYLNQTLGLQSRRAHMSGSGFNGGGQGGADLWGTPGLAIEAKAVQALNFREALAQATRNRASHPALTETFHELDIPVVINRRNHEPLPDAVVALRLSDFITLYAAYLHHTGRK